MTVEEFIEELSTMPPTATVTISTEGGNEYEPVSCSYILGDVFINTQPIGPYDE